MCLININNKFYKSGKIHLAINITTRENWLPRAKKNDFTNKKASLWSQLDGKYRLIKYRSREPIVFNKSITDMELLQV